MKNVFEKYGLRRVRNKIRQKQRQRRERENFQKWVKLDDESKLENRETIRQQIENLARRPLISVLLPVYNIEEKWLRRCIESVTKQIYENWELCIADDCSPSPHIRKILEEYAAKDERVKIVFRRENGHISAASNSALELATGDFVGLLDHDDELSEDALFHVAAEINAFPETDFIYTDEDKIDETGARNTPFFKPDFSRDYLYSVNYVTHFAVYRTEVLRQVGGFRIGLEGSQDYDLALRVIEKVPENHIRHIPKILYHWRAIKGSVALGGDEKPYAHERAREAIAQHLERTGKSATVEKAIYNLHRVHYKLPAKLPKVSLILAADENFTRTTLENFIGQTDYANYEIILVTNARADKLANFGNVKIIVCENASEAERFNRAAAQADGEILCFADANLKALTKNWLKELTSFALQKEIGAVGAKITGAEETVLHGGLVIGASGIIRIAHHHFSKESDGYFMRAQVINNFSAVSISCLATRREVFDSVGGFDAENFPDNFFDADYCLRLGKKNQRIVFTPYAELIKVDEKQRLNFEKNTTAAEESRFVGRWKNFIEHDPFYNPNLSKKDASFSIDI